MVNIKGYNQSNNNCIFAKKTSQVGAIDIVIIVSAPSLFGRYQPKTN